MTPTAILTIGPPASGKTYWANEFIKQQSYQGRYRIVCRDDVRKDLFDIKDWADYEFNQDNEDRVTNICYWQIKACREQSENVIIADTNLSKDHRQDLIDFLCSLGYNIKTKFFIADLDVLIERDANREMPVGEEAIRKLYYRFMEDFGEFMNEIKEGD